MVIARLLTPADIGTYSVTIVLLTFVATIRDMGAGGYLVQEPDLTVDKVKAVWAVQLGLGVLLSLLVAGCSVPVSVFYGEPRMRDIMLVVAINYAINPFGSLTYAWQMREMRFDSLAIVRFSSTLTGAAVSIVFALRDCGPISLAYGSLAATMVNAGMAIYFRPVWFPWFPGLKEIRCVLAYGSQTTGSAMLQTIFANTPELLLGKLQNMTATGLYSRASGLVQMFDRLVLIGIVSVATPWFATHSRDHGSISQPFIKATSYVTAIGCAFAFSLIFLAYPVMRLLYGDQWDQAVDATRVLALGLAFTVPSQLCAPALMALGGARQLFRGTLLTMCVSLPLMAIGATAGIIPLGLCLVLGCVFRSMYWLRVTHLIVGFDWSAMLKQLFISVIVGLGAAIAPAFAFIAFGNHPDNVLPSLLFGSLGSAVGFIGTIFLVNHPLRDEIQTIKHKAFARITW